MVLTSLSVRAKTAETTLWEGACDDGVELNNETVAAFVAGDVLRIYVTVPAGGGNFKICYKGASNNWAETAIPSIGNQWPWVNGGTTCADFTLTDADITTLTGMNIYIYKGENSTIDRVSKIVENPNIAEVTIGAEGICTWSSDKNLNFTGTGVTAYYASGVSEGTVTLTPTATTWGWQGYILTGSQGTYDVPVVGDEEAFYPRTNYLKQQVVADVVAASTEGRFHYIFAKKGDEEPGFYKLTADHTLAANKAYLETDADITPGTSPVKGLNLIFDDATTGICPARTLPKRKGKIYTLGGARAQRPTRGLYIAGGRKVVIR